MRNYKSSCKLWTSNLVIMFINKKVNNFRKNIWKWNELTMGSHKINNWEFKEHNSKMLKISFFGKLINTQQKNHVDHKHVYVWNYIFLLHSSGNLYSYLHKFPDELYGFTNLLIDPDHGLYESIGIHEVSILNLKKIIIM